MLALAFPLIESQTAIDINSFPTILLPTVDVSQAISQKIDQPKGFGLIALYLFITLIMFVRLVKRAIKINTHSHTNVSFDDDIKIVGLVNSSDAYSFFNTIFLGDQLKGNVRTTILNHEKIHVQANHSFDLIYFEILSCIFWFNPIFKKYRQLSEENHEYIVDASISTSTTKSSYIQLISEYALNRLGYSIEHHFAKPIILHRINMLNNQNYNIMKIKFATPLLLSALLFGIFSCDNTIDTTQVIHIDQEATQLPTSGEKIFDIVDNQPMPTNGMTGLYDFIRTNLKYPSKARKEGIEGRVFIQFLVEPDGSLSNIKSIKGIDPDCDREAERVMKLLPKWTPGIHEGKAVRVRMILPISYKLT